MNKATSIKKMKKELKALEEAYDNANGRPVQRFHIMRRAGRIEHRIEHSIAEIKATNTSGTRPIAGSGSSWGTYHWTQGRAFTLAIARRRAGNKVARKSRRINRLRMA